MESLKPQMQPPQTESYDYRVLTPEPHHTQLRTNEQLHEKYLYMLSTLVDDLVGDPATRCDTLVFLDKSARPLAWMMRTFWDEIAPQEREEGSGTLKTIPMPDMKFINIDRLQWRADPNQEMTEGGIKEITPSDIEGLRDIFKKGNKSLLDGKKIAIIDEQSESGDTLKIADRLFSQAFPASDIKTTAWINHPSTQDNSGTRDYGIKEIPIWYPLKGTDKLAEEERGRGVFSPIPYERRSESFKRRFKPESNQYLASRPQLMRQLDEEGRARIEATQAAYEAATDENERKHLLHKLDRLTYTSVDTKSDQLRRDIGHMLLDFTNGKITPSIVTERETIRGLPAQEYYDQRQKKARTDIKRAS